MVVLSFWRSSEDMVKYLYIHPLGVTKRKIVVGRCLGLVIYTNNDIAEELDTVIPHVRICVRTVQVTGRSTMTFY